MHQDRINRNNNMLYYSNASNREKNRRYLVIKGGLAWLLWQGGVFNSIVELGSNSVGLVVYQREEGEETMNTMQTDAYRCMTRQVTMLDVP